MKHAKDLGGVRSPAGDYLEKADAIERAVGNWIDGERGYSWDSMREFLELHYQAIPEEQRLEYRERHQNTLQLIANCEKMEEEGIDPKDLL